jgi:hypothetical protein
MIKALALLFERPLAQHTIRLAAAARAAEKNLLQRTSKLALARASPWPRAAGAAPEQCDELTPLHVEHGDFLPDALSASRLARAQFFRISSLPQGEFPLLRNRGLGPVAVAVLPIALARRAAATA